MPAPNTSITIALGGQREPLDARWEQILGRPETVVIEIGTFDFECQISAHGKNGVGDLRHLAATLMDAAARLETTLNRVTA